MLESAGQGAARIICPTRRNLERLAVHADYAALEAHARSITVRNIQPRTEEAEGQRWLVIPDDQGYPLTREPPDSAERGEQPALSASYRRRRKHPRTGKQPDPHTQASATNTTSHTRHPRHRHARAEH